jgi:D-serine deaminase-like pyridoxal phosphate-dependent protein
MSSIRRAASAWTSAPERRIVIQLDTPVPVVDLDRLDANLARWQAECDRLGLVNRPHVKTHKCVEIARRQLAAGAVGLTCQKLGEAEVMAGAGFIDLLVPYNLVGEAKLTRLTELLPQAAISVSVDDERLLPGLSEAAAAAGTELPVLVECDTGLGRAGVGSPYDAVALATAVARHESLRFEGFLTYPSLPGVVDFLAAAVDGARQAGLEVRSVSAGGTPSMWSCEHLMPTVTEYRVGTYAFHDRNTVAAGAASLDDVALTVRATVVSRPTAARAILDCGSKALSSDRGPDEDHGRIVEAPGSAIVALNEEHAYVEVAPGDSLELGRQVRVVPNHACVVSNLFDEFVVVRGDEIVDHWPIEARGRSA